MPRKVLGYDRGLTSREKSILEYIRQKIEESGYPLPSGKSAMQSVSVPLQQFMVIWEDWKSWE